MKRCVNAYTLKEPLSRLSGMRRLPQRRHGCCIGSLFSVNSQLLSGSLRLSHGMMISERMNRSWIGDKRGLDKQAIVNANPQKVTCSSNEPNPPMSMDKHEPPVSTVIFMVCANQASETGA